MASRIAYVLWKFPALSETFVVEELRALEATGIRAEVIALERPREEPVNPRAEPLLGRATWLGEAPRVLQVRRAAAGVARSPLRFLRCLAAALGTKSRWSLLDLWYGTQLSALARERRVEFLYAHFADHAAEVTWFASRMTGVPYGMVAHGVDIYLGRMLCRKLRDASLPVTVCQYNLGQLSSRCPEIDPSRVLVKPAGIDVTAFRRSTIQTAADPPVVVAIGRLVEKKGFDVLIRAVALLHDDGTRIECRIIGEGRCRRGLEALIAELGLDEQVHLMGGMVPDHVRQELEGATLLAAPCTISLKGDRDSMPVVIKEAMAMEVPVVASRDFGIPELVGPECGVLVPRDDPRALAEAMAAVLALPPEQRRAMGRAGRRRVEEHFDEAHLVNTLADALRGA